MATRKKKSKVSGTFDKFSNTVVKVTGSPVMFLSALGAVIVWALCGPLFGFSDTWQLVINTSTTIITFLMVFVIQQAQNKDSMALHLKLNELLASTKGASNRVVNIEDLTEEELLVLKKFYIKISKLAQQESDLHQTHTIDEAQKNHEKKLK